MPTTINGVVVQDQGDSTLTGSTDPLTGTTALTITRLGAYATGTGEGSGEVFAYDKATKRLFVMNNDTDMVEVVDITDPAAMVKVSEINVGSLAGYGGMNSVAVAGGILAVAVENSAAGTGGMLAFYSATTGGLLNTVTVGVLPDMLTFTPDGKKLVVANEGERAGILDPEGSISLIDLSAGVASATVQTTGFAALDGQEDALRALGVRITPGRPASTDIEPEYISLSADGKTAYVTLQEANSIGVFDISGTTPVLQSILPLGYVDHSLVGNESDFSDRDAVGSSAGAINLHNAPIRGMPMPDAIATFVIGGVTYFATANEGDARSDDSDVARLSGIDLNDGAFPDETALKNEDNAGRLNISTIDGDTNPGSGADAGLEQIHTFGGRGISLFKVNADGTIEKVDEVANFRRSSRRSCRRCSTPIRTIPRRPSTRAPTTRGRSRKPSTSPMSAATFMPSSGWSGRAASWSTTSPIRRTRHSPPTCRRSCRRITGRRSCNTSIRWTARTARACCSPPTRSAAR
jgi:hypothetical protein